MKESIKDLQYLCYDIFNKANRYSKNRDLQEMFFIKQNLYNLEKKRDEE